MQRLTFGLIITAILAMMGLAVDMALHVVPSLGTTLLAALAVGLAFAVPVYRADNQPAGACADCGGEEAFGFCMHCGSTKIWSQARSS